MSVLKTYEGRPVKRMSQQGSMIKLVFVSSEAGKPGQQALISQEQWDKHGVTETLAVRPDVREMARSFE